MKKPELIIILVLCALAVARFTACAPVVNTNPPTPSSIPSSTVTGGITLLTTAGVAATLDFAIQQPSTRARIGGYIYTDASLTLQLVGGAALTPDQYQAYLVANGIKGDAQYTAFVPTAVSLYRQFVYPKLQTSSGPAIAAYLTAFATGLQNGAAAYAPATVLPTGTTLCPKAWLCPAPFKISTHIRPRYGWLVADNVY